jgi:pimeloyl-ACP methyl ester carboxylesterase
MTEKRMHRAVSDDGTEICASVHGDGPPLLLVHGAMDDGEGHWHPSLPFLTDRFTCYVMSLRNRGLSGPSQDLSPPRQVDDVVALAASIDGPVALAGLSMGGALALAAAARLDTLSAVAAYEPALLDVASEEDYQRFVGTIMHVAEHATQGRPIDAVRTFYELMGNDEEVAALSTRGAFETLARNVAVELDLIQQATQHEGPRPGNPEELQQISAPVLLLRGGRSNMRSWFHRAVEHVAQHVSEPHEHEFTDAGHLAPMVNPEPVAGELAKFVEAVRQPA